MYPPTMVDFREGDVRHSLADISKARRLLNYTPLYSLDKGLEIAINWYTRDLNISSREGIKEAGGQN